MEEQNYTIFLCALLYEETNESSIKYIIDEIKKDIILQRGIQIVKIDNIHSYDLLKYNSRKVSITELPIFVMTSIGNLFPKIYSLNDKDSVYQIVKTENENNRSNKPN